MEQNLDYLLNDVIIHDPYQNNQSVTTRNPTFIT